MIEYQNYKTSIIIYWVNLFILLPSFMFGLNSELQNIDFSDKQNGILAKFTFNKGFDINSISAWQADNNWFYFTFFQTSSDTTLLLNKTYNPIIKSFQPIVSPESTQIGIKLKKEIENFSFSNSKDNNIVYASLHYYKDDFNSLPAVLAYQKKEKITRKKKKELKKWSYYLGTSLTILGLAENKDTSLKGNLKLQIGLAAIISAYLS